MAYRRNIHPILNRILSIWHVISRRNYILICVKEFEEKGEKGRNISMDTRTDYGIDSDMLTLTAAFEMKKKKRLKEGLSKQRLG